jgi:hypothetical protein
MSDHAEPLSAEEEEALTDGHLHHCWREGCHATLTAERAARDSDSGLREALTALRRWTGPSIPTDLAVLIVNVERAAEAALATPTAKPTEGGER